MEWFGMYVQVGKCNYHLIILIGLITWVADFLYDLGNFFIHH